MTPEVEEHVAFCWQRGLSVGATIRSVKRILGVDVGFHYVQAIFAQLAQDAYGFA
ncbi:MAG: hypothetical protein KGL39_42140 [Patescibacteria group bacterium]|nr:hypothetical protein [Patescibacteria group bacterium]